MASEPTTVEIRESDISPRAIRMKNISDNKNSETGPIFKHSRIRFYKDLRWDKILIILIFMMVFILLTLTIIFMTLSYHFNQQLLEGQKPEKSDEPCLTLACLHASVDITKSIDPLVDPCSDFHRFVCGNWEDKQIFPNGKSIYGTFDVVNDELLKIQKRILENQNNFDLNSPLANGIRFYNSCNNMETIGKLGASPFRNHLARIYNKYGGWDMLQYPLNFPIDSWDIRRVVEDPDVDNPVFDVVVSEDEKDSKKYAIYIMLGSLLLEKKYLENITISENKKIYDAYLQYMDNIGRLLIIHPSRSFYFSEILDFEVKMALRYPTEKEQRDPDSNYNKMSVNQLQTDICPMFNWINILNRRFLLVNITLSPNTNVIVTAKENLKSICALLETYTMSSTKKLILHNYVMWKFVSNQVKYLSQEFLDAQTKFDKVYKGTVGNRQRWEICVEAIQNHMEYVIGNMYITQQFNKKSKPQVLEMINLMKEKFRKNLAHNTWMDPATISEAIKKIDNMLPLVGYSDLSLNRTFIEQYYQGITLNNESYYDNINHLNKLAHLKMLQKFGRPVENSSIDLPQIVNAFYNPNKNEIMFPAGILQNPFFDPEFLRSLNYGAIGCVIGHEITHGFDNTGSKYDADGNLRQWWTNSTRALFMERSSCIIDQYSKYSLYGHSINALNTLGENIADNGGLRLTYQVFKDLENQYGTEKKLPSLGFTHDQLFFISFARLWCGIETKESTIFSIFTKSHTPAKYRIIGVLSNTKEFADAFNCPLGSPMNPDKKCLVW